MTTAEQIKNVVFDLGGVLIDWNPRYLYRKIFKDPQAMEDFLATVCTHEWNEQQDGGRSFAAATQELVQRFPHLREEVLAFDHRWEEMLGNAIQGTVQVFEKIRAQNKHRLLGLSNWSHEKFPIAEKRFDFLQKFEGIVVSGRVKMKKPDPRIYNHLCSTYSIVPQESVFVDDAPVNIRAAQELGFHTIHFSPNLNLEKALQELGVL